MSRVPTWRYEPPPRTLVRNVFLRLLGVLFVIAFCSLLAQITLLVGPRGLLPAEPYLQRLPFRDAPSLFHFGASDAMLRGAGLLGVALGLALAGGLAPRWCLLGLWALYLSFVHAGQDFFAFQWDNLLLESAFFALFVTPRGLRLRGASGPHPLAVFLMLWLLFRLHVESGLAKLLLGDPTWRDLTAMASYYETAPLPTPLAWWAHQQPLWAHRMTAGYVYVAELGLPLLMWGPGRLRTAVFAALAAMQVVIGLTANYGFFNLNSLALLLFVLDDRHLERLRRRPVVAVPGVRSAARNAAWAATVAVLILLSVVPFLAFLRMPRLEAELRPVRRVLAALRSVNAYHLFAQMTGVRREVVIEGSDDGVTWQAYEFRYKPGDPDRAPPFVAPHQPRVDFQLWFLLLGGRYTARYFDTLLARLLTEPALVRPLFARDPFPDTPPKRLRVAYYRYRFTDLATGRATDAWWTRELLGYSRELPAASFGR